MYNLLDGLKIIEASSFVASPTAGLYCAQFGAEVIRVDQVGGGPDYHRWPVTEANVSLYWENLNRAKKSVALDLVSPQGRELLQELDAHKVIELQTCFRLEDGSRILALEPSFADLLVRADCTFWHQTARLFPSPPTTTMRKEKKAKA